MLTQRRFVLYKPKVPHKKNKRLILNRFNEAFKIRLAKRQISHTSPTEVADAFNLRAAGTSVITRQTAAKWLNGETLLDHGYMAVLVSWLNLDLNQIYDLKQPS